MNQTQKRLSIIKLAISIGDIETIQLQILKLSPLKTDERIQEIIRGLQSENYAQTQALITEYIETPTEEILQRTSQHDTPSPEEAEAIIEEFDLFRINPEEEMDEPDEILDINAFDNTQTKESKQGEKSSLDALLNLKSEDVLPDTPDIPQTLPKEDDFFDVPDETQTAFNYTDVVEKDDFFHAEEPLQDDSEKTDQENDSFLSNIASQTEEAQPSETSVQPAPTQKTEIPETYEPIPYIDQKLKNMQTQYPPLEEPEGTLPSVDAWLMKISNEGYTEREVEEMMAYIQRLSENGNHAEAAQLLLISAATQSRYAQFMLARSLFKGDLLEKNLPEAFTIINRLAMDDDYPEAICDLGQLYEYGIGIDKDMVRAEELYKEAMELGIQRAASHYKRVHQANKSLFAKLFRR
jgi:hypothetical protein